MIVPPLVRKLAELLGEKGEPLDFDCRVQEVDHYFTVAKKNFGERGFCAVENWSIWDLEVNEVDQKDYLEMGLIPSVLYGGTVLHDIPRRFQAGSYVMSTPAVIIAKPFFVTKNTVYVLVGPGGRKKVNPELVDAFYY